MTFDPRLPSNIEFETPLLSYHFAKIASLKSVHPSGNIIIQTDIQSDRQTDRRTDEQTDRQIDKHTN